MLVVKLLSSLMMPLKVVLLEKTIVAQEECRTDSKEKIKEKGVNNGVKYRK